MRTPPPLLPSRLFKKAFALCGLMALTGPLTSSAQQIVFHDTFGSSTLNGQSGSMLPGGTPTASYTSYEIGSGKSATATTNSAGSFQLITSGTSSGNSEAQALFTKFPVTLATNGDYIELDYTFLDTTDILNNLCGNACGLYCGLYNSGGVAPLSGTLLWNGGMSTGSTTADTGGTKSWAGYLASMVYGQTAISGWGISSRPPQTAVNNGNQALLYGFPLGGSTHTVNPTGSAPFPTTVLIGSQYTAQLRITLSAAGTLTVSNALYTGTDTTGAIIFSNITTYTGANLLSTNFDGLAFGYRDGDSASPHIPWTNSISSITVVASLAAQAGPYYFLTSSGNGCGGATIGLSGSVTTNVYLLSTNGIPNGQVITGTGSAISFGLETSPAVYTIIASNTATASTGPMLGTQTISQSAPVITVEPASFSGVTNAPASFSVTATGNTLTYQWYKNGVALTNGGDFSGVTTTNLIVSPARAADAATMANGYYVVVQDPCGDSTTSTPNAALTLLAPNNLVWQGGNPNNNWDLTTTLNFTNRTGAFEAFTNGDNVTFDNSSPNTSVIISNTLVPTAVIVTGNQNYELGGPGSLTGFGQLLDIDTATLSITNVNTYTGGTIISNGATLSLGDGTTATGSLVGSVTINSNSILHYYYNNDATVNNNSTVSGNGTVLYDISTGNHTYTIPTTSVSSNFTGTNIIDVGVALHCSDGNNGYLLGNGGVVTVANYAQAWLDRSATNYNQTFIINGQGWYPTSGPQLGALRIYGCTISGPVILASNARIGGTINGGTISGQISGNNQLEVFGNTNSFILSVGSTNGPNTYGTTLVTSGAIRALTSGGISTNALYDDLLGEVDVYGNNVSINSLNDGPNGAGVVYNMSTTTNGTLIVGADGSSTTFDGVFGDGSSKSLSLTKVGAGTLTVTAVSTNTGTIAVNGGTLSLGSSASFAKATVYAPGNGGIYDVSSVGGLTLGSGQTLKGSGTVNGSVVANAGSIINPGDTIGALTISGNLTLSGTTMMELNRTNAPATNDSLIVTGTLTTGGTLNVTNLGPALHAGDSFQLFAAGAPGFTSVNLETNDIANNTKYTWNNTIASNGKISVATVVSLVNTSPTNIVTTVSGGNLTLTWPADHTGWTLQSQTNTLNKGIGTNWVDIAGSSATNQVIIPITTTNASVFYRMRF